jgi:hypothetical protein
MYLKEVMYLVVYVKVLSDIYMIEKMKNIFFVVFIYFLLTCCKKENYPVTYDEVRTIKISDKITIDNGTIMNDPVFNCNTYEQFLKYLVESDRFLIVPQKDFDKTTSNDKVVLSIRHDVDDNINAALKFAYRESKYGIKATYFILHTASYYGVTKREYFKRNDQIKDYLLTIQNTFDHEVGFHNDLVTLQVCYRISPKIFLKNELEWLRSNGLIITGTVAHGSPYCHIYHYLNSYFWEGVEKDPSGFFDNWETVIKGYETIVLEKDKMSNYGFDYEGYDLKCDYYFADDAFFKGKRWQMGMINWDTIKPGKKVILLLHPQHWD